RMLSALVELVRATTLPNVAPAAVTSRVPVVVTAVSPVVLPNVRAPANTAGPLNFTVPRSIVTAPDPLPDPKVIVSAVTGLNWNVPLSSRTELVTLNAVVLDAFPYWRVPALTTVAPL